MVYITGDTHRNFNRVITFCDKFNTSKEDVLIILGDVGINFWGEEEDKEVKKKLSQLPISFFCIHGNHEMRPESIATYKETERYGGTVYWEPEFPNLLFAKDSEIYVLGGKRSIAIGGAYSVDKDVRIMSGYGWWPDEQPSAEIMKRVTKRLDSENWSVDFVLSHTCPYNRMGDVLPYRYPGVDSTTEKWLETIEERLTYIKWYCGHFHKNVRTGSMQFLYEDIIMLDARNQGS